MSHLLSYWSSPELISNGIVLLNIGGAMALGILLGYERSFHGHSAGMRTYGLVCTSAAALTVVCGYPSDWYGGVNAIRDTLNADPTRVIQGIVTGIGFLGAGVIMKEGYTVRGLSTAASIWATAVIGIIIGVGFYATAIVTTILVMIVMGCFKKLELRLPHRRQIRLNMTYQLDQVGTVEDLGKLMRTFGYIILELSCLGDSVEKHFVYELVMQGNGTHNFNQLVEGLRQMDSLVQFRLSPVSD